MSSSFETSTNNLKPNRIIDGFHFLSVELFLVFFLEIELDIQTEKKF